MKRIQWRIVIFYIGVAALIVGILDPLEGSVVIVAGSALIALATYLMHDRDRKFFLISLIMIVIGVSFLFYLSSLGGFGGESDLSWLWGLFILPYPAGWIVAIVILIKRMLSKGDNKTAKKPTKA